MSTAARYIPPTVSTVVAIEKDRLRIIRAGEISREALAYAVGKGVIEL
jgi:tRNA A37 threonylcarbamoyladenosine synthetase subunit TsaC/SUA5/YrdC